MAKQFYVRSTLHEYRNQNNILRWSSRQNIWSRDWLTYTAWTKQNAHLKYHGFAQLKQRFDRRSYFFCFPWSFILQVCFQLQTKSFQDHFNWFLDRAEKAIILFVAFRQYTQVCILNVCMSKFCDNHTWSSRKTIFRECLEASMSGNSLMR